MRSIMSAQDARGPMSMIGHGRTFSGWKAGIFRPPSGLCQEF